MWWFPTPPLYSTSKIGGCDLHFVSHFQLSGLVIALLVSRAVVHLLQWIVGPQSCISHIMVFPPPHILVCFPAPHHVAFSQPHIMVCPPHPMVCPSTPHQGVFPIVVFSPPHIMVCFLHPPSWSVSHRCVFAPPYIMVCFPSNSHHGVFSPQLTSWCVSNPLPWGVNLMMMMKSIQYNHTGYKFQKLMRSY